jgi:hypothetical protein
MLIANSSNGFSANSSFNPIYVHAVTARARLSSSTEIVVTNGVNAGNLNQPGAVDWQVIEYF